MCSFSSCGDDLGQWRSYGDNGRGYALGFDAKAFENGFVGASPMPNTEAFAMTYNDSQLDNLLGQIIERIVVLISLPGKKSLQNAGYNDYMSWLYTWVTLYILRAALFFKHKAYDNEKEYRFLEYYGVDVTPPNIKRRSRSYSLIRYKEFAWRGVAAGALKEIVVGPAADKQKARQFAEDCLHLFPPEIVPITYSTIPYRAV
jgi:hypothetical protein